MGLIFDAVDACAGEAVAAAAAVAVARSDGGGQPYCCGSLGRACRTAPSGPKHCGHASSIDEHGTHVLVRCAHATLTQSADSSLQISHMARALLADAAAVVEEDVCGLGERCL